MLDNYVRSRVSLEFIEKAICAVLVIVIHLAAAIRVIISHHRLHNALPLIDVPIIVWLQSTTITQKVPRALEVHLDPVKLLGGKFVIGHVGGWVILNLIEEAVFLVFLVISTAAI